jgi:2-hydroxychromene-2-carboxylate isomerase
VSHRFWRRALDIEDENAIGAIIAEIGGDRDGFARYLAGPGRVDYAAIVATAEERGVFGVPSFLLDGELFWGADRIWLLRERLAAKEASL